MRFGWRNGVLVIGAILPGDATVGGDLDELELICAPAGTETASNRPGLYGGLSLAVLPLKNRSATI
jgi:hypothetical protein